MESGKYSQSLYFYWNLDNLTGLWCTTFVCSCRLCALWQQGRIIQNDIDSMSHMSIIFARQLGYINMKTQCLGQLPALRLLQQTLGPAASAGTFWSNRNIYIHLEGNGTKNGIHNEGHRKSRGSNFHPPHPTRPPKLCARSRWLCPARWQTPHQLSAKNIKSINVYESLVEDGYLMAKIDLTANMILSGRYFEYHGGGPNIMPNIQEKKREETRIFGHMVNASWSKVRCLAFS